MSDSPGGSSDTPSGTWRVLLVQAPLGNSFKQISGALHWSETAIGDIETSIPWDEADVDAIPSTISKLSFIRHYALALVPGEIWGAGESLSGRNSRTRLSGKQGEPRDGVGWVVTAMHPFHNRQQTTNGAHGTVT